MTKEEPEPNLKRTLEVEKEVLMIDLEELVVEAPTENMPEATQVIHEMFGTISVEDISSEIF